MNPTIRELNQQVGPGNLKQAYETGCELSKADERSRAVTFYQDKFNQGLRQGVYSGSQDFADEWDFKRQTADRIIGDNGTKVATDTLLSNARRRGIDLFFNHDDKWKRIVPCVVEATKKARERLKLPIPEAPRQLNFDEIRAVLRHVSILDESAYDLSLDELYEKVADKLRQYNVDHVSKESVIEAILWAAWRPGFPGFVKHRLLGGINSVTCPLSGERRASFESHVEMLGRIYRAFRMSSQRITKSSEYLPTDLETTNKIFKRAGVLLKDDFPRLFGKLSRLSGIDLVAVTEELNLGPVDLFGPGSSHGRLVLKCPFTREDAALVLQDT